MARPKLEIGTWGKIGFSWDGDRVRAYANYRFADGTTARRERWGATEAEAESNLKRYLRSLSGGDDKLSRHSSVADVAKKWLKEAHEQELDTTFKRYESCYNQQVKPAISELKLHECKTSRLQKVIDDLQRAGYSYSTCVMTKVVMRHIFTYAVVNDLMDINPARELKKVKRTDRKRIRAFDDEELREFLAAVDADRHMRRSYLPDLLRFLFGTGCRIGEALAVRWQDVNLTGKKIKVTHPEFGDQEIPPYSVWINGNIVHGEGGLVRHDGKTDTSEGIIGLPSMLVTMLQYRLPDDAPASQPVFPTARGGYRGPNQPLDSIRRLCRRIGYEDFSSRWGRKTAATWLKSQGQSAGQVANQLRHANEATAEKHYTARVANPEAAAVLDRLFKPKSESA